MSKIEVKPYVQTLITLIEEQMPLVKEDKNQWSEALVDSNACKAILNDYSKLISDINRYAKRYLNRQEELVNGGEAPGAGVNDGRAGQSEVANT